MDEAERQRRLREGLVGQRWQSLYFNDAPFHDAVNRLAALLPLWIDAIAEQAGRDVVGREEALRLLQNAEPVRPKPSNSKRP